jgi:hypothetical protein
MLGWGATCAMAKPHGPEKMESAAVFARREGCCAFVLDDAGVIRSLKAAVKHQGGQSAFARLHGVDASYINKILNGKRTVNSPVAKTLGLRRVYIAAQNGE